VTLFSARGALLFAALTAAAPALRAEVSFTAEADKTTVALDDAVTVRVTLSGEGLNGARPVVPDMPGFRASPAGQSQNVSFINGHVSSTVSHTYVLQPLAVGRQTIPSFTVQADGKTYATAPIPVEVTPAGARPAAPPAGAAESRGANPGGRELFLTAALDKTSAYVGEAVTLSVRFHSRARLLAQPGYAPPDTTGFLTEDLPPQRQYVEALTGPDGAVRRYTVVELKTALFPAAPGVATVGPASLECRTEDFSEDDDPFGGGLFRNFFSGGRPVVLRSQPVSLKVLPLPAEGRPANFRGDVGRYRMTAALDRTTAALHEPVTLVVTVSGEGNLNALSAPTLPALPGFKTYETLSSLNVSKDGWKVSGSKVFRTVLKPDVSGKLSIPPVAFSYFDPAAKTYRTITAGPLSLTVTGAAAEEPAAAPPPSAEGLKVLSQDIRYLKEGPLRRRTRPFHASPLFLLLNLLPPLAFAGLAMAQAARRRAEADPARRALKRAGGRAAAALDRAGDFITNGRPGDAADALERALREYLAAKTGRSAPGITWEDAAAALKSRGASAPLVDEARALWDALLGARYAPGGFGADAAAGALKDFKRMLPALEALWKK
jgi:hypothetical protein